MHANGLGQSVLPYGGLHTVLGALPALIHPSPVSIAVIGLGSGDTVFGFGGRPETQRIDSIEILAAELTALRQFDARDGYPALRMLLADPRVRHQMTDGRLLLSRASRKYDIIEADALRPTSAYAGNLYSIEYFRLLRSRLERDGLAITWTPTERVINGFVNVFPYVLVFHDSLALGSESPILFDRTQVVQRLQHAFTRDYYRRGGVDIDTLINDFLKDEPKSFGPDFDRTALTDVNRDLFPKDEFAVSSKR
jgi:spermidine synthase